MYKMIFRENGEACGIKGTKASAIWSCRMEREQAEAILKRLEDEAVTEDELLHKVLEHIEEL